MVDLGTLLLFNSTLMSLVPIRVVHPGTDLLQLPSWVTPWEVQFLGIVLEFQEWYQQKVYKKLHAVASEAQRVQRSWKICLWVAGMFVWGLPSLPGIALLGVCTLTIL